MKTSKAPAYLMLAVAIGVEVFAATCMKLSTGFTNLPWTVACIVVFACSLFLLSKVLQRLPLALTYGVWGGVGTIATACIGYILWGEPFTALMALGVAVVLAGIAILGRGVCQRREEQPLALTQTTGVKRYRGYEDRPPSSPRT